jgi:hypothetical protein
MRRIVGAATVLTLALACAAGAAVNSVTPSTNDENRAKGWAHVNQLGKGIGTTELEFVSTRNFLSCFEYRTDGDTSQALASPNPNPAVPDRYPHLCVRNGGTNPAQVSPQTMTFQADDYVEVRMVFGAETNERFDWTRFDVDPDARSQGDCKDGGWASFGFKNQGQCVRFVQNGQDSR